MFEQMGEPERPSILGQLGDPETQAVLVAVLIPFLIVFAILWILLDL